MPLRRPPAGWTPATINAAATAPPSVIEPSAVMSGKSKILKLMNTPSASSDRMRPMVKAPISSSMEVTPGEGRRYAAGESSAICPIQHAPDTNSLSPSAGDSTIVVEQVQDA